MRTILKLLLTLIFLVCTQHFVAQAQIRIAVLPFQNMDGHICYDKWCYNLQDSLFSEIVSGDPEEYNYRVVPPDSVKIILDSLGFDPKDINYETKMWQAMKILNVKRVVSGNFNVKAKKLLINAYVYYVEYRLAHPRYQALNIFKSEDKVLEAIPYIHKKLRMAIIGN